MGAKGEDDLVNAREVAWAGVIACTGVIPPLILLFSIPVFAFATRANFPYPDDAKEIRTFWVEISVLSLLLAFGTIGMAYWASPQWQWKRFTLSVTCLLLTWVVFVALMAAYWLMFLIAITLGE